MLTRALLRLTVMSSFYGEGKVQHASTTKQSLVGGRVDLRR